MKRKEIKIAFALLLVGWLLASCGGSRYEPRAVNPEADVCAVCNMSVHDDPFVTQIVTVDHRYYIFDDLGCMYEWMTENGTESVGEAYVRDYHSKSWVPFDNAYYVYDASIRTPMAYGVVSFENEEDAKAFIGERGAGVLMTAQQLGGHHWERSAGGGSHTHGEADVSHGAADLAHNSAGHAPGGANPSSHGDDDHPHAADGEAADEGRH